MSIDRERTIVPSPTAVILVGRAGGLGRFARVLDFETQWRSHPLMWVIVVGVVAAGEAWLRLPPVTRDTLWAEDGRNFLQGALDKGPVDSLLIPYAGYLQALPRLAASVTVQVVPVQFYALAMTAAACLAAGAMAAIVFVCSGDVIRWMPSRLIVAMLTVLAPLAPREVLGNMANVHTLVLWTLFWTLMYRPKTRAGSYALAVAALLGSLSEIQVIFLLPLLLWHPLDRSRMWPRAGYLFGALAQLAVTILWPREASSNTPLGYSSVGFGFLINSVVPFWVPQKSVGPVVSWGGPALCLALAVPFALALVVCLRFGTLTQRVAALGLTGLAVVVYVVSVYENPHSYYDYANLSAAGLRTLWLARYGVGPSMMLGAVLALAAAVAAEHRRQRLRGNSAGSRSLGACRRAPLAAWTAAGLLVLLLLVQFYPQGTRRSNGPAWQPQLAALRAKCERMPDEQTVNIRETIGWHVSVSCGRLG